MTENIDHFTIHITKDRMVATIDFNREIDGFELPLSVDEIKALLEKYKIKFGIIDSALKLITSSDSPDIFPVEIAHGKQPIDGENATMKLHVDMLREIITNKEVQDFRNVMKIPSVEKDEKLSTIIPETKGENGIDVYGNEVVARDGKKTKIKPGKNVVFNEEDLSFYSLASGEVRLTRTLIEVQAVYEVFDGITMETGNIDFPGTVIIHGDVPSGFTIKAGKDVKINGLVEAAEIYAKGSVYIAEGFSGMKKGRIFAHENVFAGYINQGTVRAGRNIQVENSILHSTCFATKQILLKDGNIIGGEIQAGERIEAKDIGNRLNIKTYIQFGLAKEFQEEVEVYHKEKDKLIGIKEQLERLGRQLSSRESSRSVKVRVALLKQRMRLQQINEELLRIEQSIQQLEEINQTEHKSKLFVQNYLYPNTVIGFGKYQTTVKGDYYLVEATFEQNEIKFLNH